MANTKDGDFKISNNYKEKEMVTQKDIIEGATIPSNFEHIVIKEEPFNDFIDEIYIKQETVVKEEPPIDIVDDEHIPEFHTNRPTRIGQTNQSLLTGEAKNELDMKAQELKALRLKQFQENDEKRMDEADEKRKKLQEQLEKYRREGQGEFDIIRRPIETPEQRERRLERRRAFIEERKRSQEKGKHPKQIRIKNETATQREYRLHKVRTYKREKANTRYAEMMDNFFHPTRNDQ